MAWDAIRRFYGLRASLMAWLIVSALSMLNLLMPLDAMLYSALGRWPLRPDIKASVVLVEVPYASLATASAASAASDWPALVDRLTQAGAQQIVITLPLPPEALSALAAHPARSKLLLGVAMGPTAADPQTTLDALQGTQKLGLRAAPFGLPSRGEALRHIGQSHTVGEQRLPSLEAVAAQARGMSGAYLPPSGLAPKLPVISLAHLQRESPAPELMRGRTVIVGLGDHTLLQSVQVPGHVQPMSLLTYQGLAINALANEQAVSPLPWPIALALTLLSCLLVASALQPLRLRQGSLYLAVALAVQLAVTWVLMTLTAFWYPLLEAALIELATFVAVYRSKSRREGRELQRLVQLTASELQRRSHPASFQESADYWDFVVKLVDQTLNVQRMIFLQRIPGQKRLREVRALRCSIDDIHEMRRDYQRTPYTTAIQARRAVAVERYLRGSDEAECQYLVPLIFGGEVMGFWAFSVRPEDKDDIEAQQRGIAATADQIALLLFKRQLAHGQEQQRHNPLAMALADDHIGSMRVLHQSLQLMEQRYGNLERIFNSSSNAAVLYDLFGRVIQINPRMSALLKRRQLAPSALTAADLIADLTRYALPVVKERVRDLVLARQPFALPAQGMADDAGFYTLHATPLVAGDQAPDGTASPFDITGILVELVDGNLARQSAEVAADAYSHINLIVTDKLQSTALAAHLLAQPALSATAREQAQTVLEESLAEAGHWLQRARRALTLGADLFDKSERLAEPTRLLHRALDDAQGVLRERHLQVELGLPSFSLVVDAEASALQQLFIDLLHFLAEDAHANARLNIAATHTEQHIVFNLRNEGVGMPNARLQALLNEHDEASLSETMQALRQGRRLLQQWRGDLTLLSAIGEGIQAELRLHIAGRQMPKAIEASSLSPDVLIVEDHSKTRDMMRAILALEGQRVALASDGQQAIAALARGQAIPVVVLDLVMTVSDGLDVLAWLQDHPDLAAQTKVVVITGLEDNHPAMSNPLLHAPFVAAKLRKPFAAPSFFALLHALLNAKPRAH